MSKSFFVILEGLDCSGKTSLIKFLKQKINSQFEINNYFKNKILFTFEPGGKDLEFGKNIRKFIFDNKKIIFPTTETLLFLASRYEHIKKKIKPAIEENYLIFCDRYYLSTLAYQGFYEKVNIKWILDNMNFLSENTKPNLTFFLNISEENYKKFFKKKELQKKINSYDENYKNFKKMHSSYLQAVNCLKNLGEKIIELDGNNDFEKNTEIIFKEIKKHINS